MTKTRRLVIVGAGETALLAHEYFTCDSPFEVVAFSVERAFLREDRLEGLPVVPLEELAARYAPDSHYAFVAVSYTKLNRVRTRLYQQCKAQGFRMASYVSSRAFVWRNVQIGDNCFILEQNVLQYAVRIGNNVTLWSGNHVGHQSIVHDNVFVSSHVVISGYCEVGDRCFLGVNSCVADHVKVAPDCLIAAGAVVLRPTQAAGLYQGNPAARRPGITALQYFQTPA